MTNTVFSMFQTQYIPYTISYQQAVVVEHWDFPNTEISRLKMSLLEILHKKLKNLFFKFFINLQTAIA
jgi:hypothetical protein